MHFLFTIAPACPYSDSISRMLELIGVAAIIWAVFNGLRKLLVKPATSGTHAAVTAPVVAPAAAPRAAASDDITPEILAVIAAAVATLTDASHRIVSIKRSDSLWEKAGRQSVLTSHRIR